MGNLAKRVIGYLYKYFGMGGVQKIPIIKIGVGITDEDNGQGERHVLLKTARYGARFG